MKHIPNALTICRILFIPIILIAIEKEEFLSAIIFFTLSSITDILDGIIARKFNLVSDFGKLMDPLADKLTQLSVVFMLAFKSVIPSWIFIVLILKELIMMIGGLYLYKRKDIVVYSKWYGKATTVLMYIAVVSSCLIRVIPSLQFKIYLFNQETTFDVIIYMVALIFALFSLVSYVVCFGKYILKKGNGEEKNG